MQYGLLRVVAIAAFAIGLVSCFEYGGEDPNPLDETEDQSELIILAAPASDDRYYGPLGDEIAAFQIAFAQRVLAAGDDVLVLADKAMSGKYRSALGSAHVLDAGQLDIWVRDFGTANANSPVLFGYTAAGQGGGRRAQLEANAVQDQLFNLIDKAGISPRESEFLNDGGNFVEDGAGMAVLSRKFLRDNRMSEHEARQALQRDLGLDHIAFIEADEQGGLEHSDGVVAFIEPGVLIINSYPDDPDYALNLRADLEAGLPGVKLHEIVAPYDGSQIFDERFGSACGLYTNMIVTPKRIYLPQFGTEYDSEAMAVLSALSDKEIVPVPSGTVCQMGGGVRCMSWQLRGEAAERLINLSRK